MQSPTVKISCPITEGNPYGFYVKNKSDLTPMDKVHVERPEEDVPREQPKRRGRPPKS